MTGAAWPYPLGTVYIQCKAQTRTGSFQRSAGPAHLGPVWLVPGRIETLGSVTFSGHAHTGSYNSSGSATPNGGSVASLNGPFSFSGSSQVNGNLYGPNSAAYASDITGTALPAPGQPGLGPMSRPLPPGPGSGGRHPPGGTSTLAPGTYGSLSVSGGQSLYLQAGGTYVFNNVSISGGSQVIVPVPCSSPIQMFFYGSLSISGGFLARPSRDTVAANLQFIQAGFGEHRPSVTDSGGTDTVCVIDAPGLPVSIGGNGDIQGAVVGASLTDSGDGHVIYDEALLALGGGGGVASLNYRRF